MSLVRTLKKLFSYHEGREFDNLYTLSKSRKHTYPGLQPTVPLREMSHVEWKFCHPDGRLIRSIILGGSLAVGHNRKIRSKAGRGRSEKVTV